MKNRYGVDEDYFRQKCAQQAMDRAAYLYPGDSRRQGQYVLENLPRMVAEHCYPISETCKCCGRTSYTKEWERLLTLT